METQFDADLTRARAVIRDEIVAIPPFDVTEHADQRRVLEWLDSTSDIWRRAKPAVPPMHLISYFIVLSDDHVLLGDHVISGRWLPGGGHVEVGENPRRTVERELAEEFGLVADFMRHQAFFLSLVDTVGATAGHTDVCLWYALRADRSRRIAFDTREFRSVQWFPFDRLPLERDPSMTRAIAKLAALPR